MRVTIDLNARSVVRWLLGALLIWAAVSKLANLNEFYGSLIGYRLPLPDFLLRFTAMALPWLELLCGLMLLARVQLRAALVWAAVLFAIFVIATGQAWARGLEISCGCFDLSLIGIGPESEFAKLMKSPGFAFVRALLLLAGAVFLLRHTGRESTGDDLATAPVGARP